MLAKKYQIKVIKMLEQSGFPRPVESKDECKDSADAFVRVDLDEKGNPRLIS